MAILTSTSPTIRTFNFLFENRADATFEEIGLISGVSCSDMGKAEAGMGVAFADYDNDGKLEPHRQQFSERDEYALSQ